MHPEGCHVSPWNLPSPRSRLQESIPRKEILNITQPRSNLIPVMESFMVSKNKLIGTDFMNKTTEQAKWRQVRKDGVVVLGV
jgi:hypothetical protein